MSTLLNQKTTATETQDPEAEDSSAVPGYKNYLIYCDESGVHGAVYYGFGSL